MRTLLLTLTMCLLALPANAQYSGGTGEPNDPYQIATAADLIALGETPEDYDKHFILTADIDLDPNLPGRKIFDKAVIAPGTSKNHSPFVEGIPFTGVFDGSGHTISHMTITGESCLGLFGYLEPLAQVVNVGVVDVNIRGSGSYVGGLVGSNGRYDLGGGSIANCYSTGEVTGDGCVGGLVGENTWTGRISASWSTGSVSGTAVIGGLVGDNEGRIANCHSSGSVSGGIWVGGLVGLNSTDDYWPEVTQCYSSATVSDTGWYVGGLVGDSWLGIVTSSFWDTQTSGQPTSWGGGTGKTTAEMQDPNTFKAAGWDFVGLSDGPHDIWAMPEGGGYPILWWQRSPLPELPSFFGGTGEPNDPYIIAAAEELNSIGHNPRLMECHFKLVDDLNLSGCLFHPIGGVDYPYVGVFDGGGHTVSHLTLKGGDDLGLFGHIVWGATLKDLGVLDVNITGTGYNTGGLVGTNGSSYRYPFTEGGLVLNCYSSGSVIATGEDSYVGGLVGYNAGSVISSHSSSSVTDTGRYSSSGGLVGGNGGSIAASYSTGSVNGTGWAVGGLVGGNGGSITTSYSTGSVSGRRSVGGLVGNGSPDCVRHSVWDVQSSGVSESLGGVGLTTAEMMDPVVLGLNGFANDPNWVLDAGCDYPRLAWEETPGIIIPETEIDWLAGEGTPDSPYRIDTADQLIVLGKASILCERHLVLGANIDLDPALPGRSVFRQALIPVFRGVFDGGGHVISNLNIEGGSYLGLFGCLTSESHVRNLGLVDVHVAGQDDNVGSLVGHNEGRIANCYSSGSVSGGGIRVGGLVGSNGEYDLGGGSIANCYSIGSVNGSWDVGGLVGMNEGSVAMSYAANSVRGNEFVGGLVGSNYGSTANCCSTGTTRGGTYVGGLVGTNGGNVTQCYSGGAVSGEGGIGGLAGNNWGVITQCYGTSTVSGSSWLDLYWLGCAGLVGTNSGAVIECYSAGAVSDTGKDARVGGLVGYAVEHSYVTNSFWDTQTSRQATSAGGTGKTTAEMQTAGTFLNAGWDFVGETANGSEDIWWILEGKDYPRLCWELDEMGVDDDGTADEQR